MAICTPASDDHDGEACTNKEQLPATMDQQQPEETISSEVSGMETGQNNENDQGLGKIQDHQEKKPGELTDKLTKSL